MSVPSVPCRSALTHTDHEAHYQVSLAATENELSEAQRLRYEVFAREWGVALAHKHLDVDALDPRCDHLIVRDLASTAVAGTYRLLPPYRAAVAGGSYAATEFDVSGPPAYDADFDCADFFMRLDLRRLSRHLRRFLGRPR